MTVAYWRFVENNKIGHLLASADLDTTEFRFAVITGDGTVANCGANGKGIGIRINKPTTGEPVEIVIAGSTAPITLAGTLSAGAYVKSDANGQAVAATTDKDNVLGQLVDGGVSGDTVECKILNISLSA